MAATLDLHAVRAELPSTQTAAYLNTGTAGPIPKVSAEALAEEGAAELAAGRISPGGFATLHDRIAALRDDLAEVVGARPGEVALTHSTTEGINIAAWGLDWNPGDEVVTTSQEHGGGLLPLYLLRRRKGIRITFADIGNGEADQALDALDKAIQRGTRAVVLSHVLYTTGAVLPLREITELAHQRGALVIADAAQSAGALAVDVHDLGIDAYAFSGQKWLLGPEGSGGLYVNPDTREGFQPTFVSFMSIEHDDYRPNDPDSFQTPPSAQRYEFALPYRPSVKGLAASLRWVREQVGREAAYAVIAENARYCWERAQELSGAEVLTPRHQLAGLIAFKVDGADPMKTVERLAENGVLIRSIPENGAFRVSTGFYNTREEIDRALALLAAHP